jgi:predicted MPP superfamily phosphohydrolase
LGFILFISAFMTLYSALHFYAFMKAKNALSLSAGPSTGLIFFMLIMVFSPALVRISEGLGFEKGAKVLAYIGYTWMGLLFLFFCASVFLDGVGLIAYISRTVINKPFGMLAISGRNAFFGALIAALLAAVYGSFEAWQIKTEHVTIPTAKLAESEGPIRIAQISDVHLGLIVREARLGRILQKVEEASPDILVSTGDLVDGQIDNLSNLVDMFREIRPRLGKFAVTGNHEFYAGITRALEFTKKAGFTVLRGEAQPAGGMVMVAGVDDPAGRDFDRATKREEESILSRVPREKLTVLLKHRPVVNQNVADRFDIQLSGHVHKGQIFPFRLVVKLFFPMISGLYDLPSGSFLYVSRGSGTWGPPIRFLSPPEVTVIDIVPQKPNSRSPS